MPVGNLVLPRITSIYQMTVFKSRGTLSIDDYQKTVRYE